MTERIGLEAALEMSGWTRNVDRYMSDLDRMNNRTSSAAGSMVGSFDGMGKKVLGAGALLGGALVGGAAAAGVAMGGVIAKGSQMAAAMEAQVSGIVAILDTSLKASGTSTADAIAQLNDEILSLSIDPSLKVDAQQAADAIGMLARNGLDLTEIAGGAAKSTVLLANATSADFGTAADIATDVMALFNIEAANMSEAVNGITSVVNNSKFGIQDYQLALAQGGGVAAAVGVEFSDFNSTIAAISPFFASGSDAGTSFKTMLQRLTPTTKPARAAMAELGLLTENGSSAFFDAQGNMKSMADISAILANATADLSEEQANVALSTIFGTDAMRAAFGVAAAGEVVYTDIEEAAKALGLSHEELADAMEGGLTQYEALQLTMQRTDAEAAAKTRIDNFAGALEIMQGVMEAVMLQIGQKFLPVWRSMAETFTGLAEEHGPKIVEFFDILAGWLADRLPTVINSAVQAIGAIVSVLFAFAVGAAHGGNVLESVLFGIEEVMSSFLSDQAFDNLIAFNEHILSLAGVLNDALGVALQFVSDHSTEFAGALAGVVAVLAAGAMVSTIVALSAAIASLFTPMGLIIAGAALLGAAWAGNWGGIQQKTQEVIDAITPYIDKAVAWLNDNIPLALTALQTKWDEVWPAIQTTAETVWTTITTAWTAATTWLETTLPTALTTMQTKWSEVWPVIQTVFEDAWAAVVEALGLSATFFETTLPTALTALQTKWGEVWPVIQTAFETAWGAVVESLGLSLTVFETTLPTALTALQTSWETVSTALQTAWQLFMDFFGPTIANLTQGFTDMVAGMEPVGGKMVELWEAARPVLTKIGIALGVVAAAINLIFLAAIRAMLDVVAAVMPQVDDIVIGVLDAMILGFQWVDEQLVALERVFRENWPAIAAEVRRAWERIQDWLEQIQEWLETKLPGYLTALADAFSTKWENMKTAVSDMWTATRKTFDVIGIWLRVTLPGWLSMMGTKWQDAWTTASGAVTGAWTTIKAAFESMKTWLEVTLQNAFTSFKDFLSGFSIPNPFTGILGTVNDLIGKIPGLNGLLGRSGAIAAATSTGSTQQQGAFPGDVSTLLSAALGVSGGLSSQLSEEVAAFDAEAAQMDNKLRQYQQRLKWFEDSGQTPPEYVQMLSEYNDLLDERNKLDQRQIALQAGLKRADAVQSKVSFLEKQNELLDVIEEKGLDIASILGGIDPKDFGADADPRQLLFLSNRISEALARQMEAELKLRAETIEERAEQEERRRKIEAAIQQFENSRTEFVSMLGSLSKYGGVANIFNADILEPMAAQIEAAQMAADAALQRYEQSGLQSDLNEAIALERERTGLIGDYYTELRKVALLQEKQAKTKRLEAQAELLTRARELGIESATWDIQFGENLGADKLLQLVEAITDAENRRALFDLQNLRIFQGLSNDFDISGEGSGLFGTFKDRVLDPLWERMHDITLSEEERFLLAQQYRREQEKILRIQEAQSQLDFLQQQMDLVELVADNGLDAASIFQGLEFGVNASIEDLIAAVTRAVEAMVGQVQAELDMHSPSRVMQRLGMLAMGSFTSGLEMMARGPAQAVRRSMSGMMTTAGQTVRNVNMNMGGVTISNGMSEALFQARVSQTVRRSI